MPNKTLSKRKRVAYLIGCVLAFFVLAPIVAFYATGYRIGDQFQFRKTGDIYIVIEGKDFSITLNDEEQESSSIFRRNLFIQNLRPDAYFLKVEKDGYHPWAKKVNVFSEKVADVYPFNLPKEPILTEIPKTFAVESKDATTTATTSSLKKNEEYAYVEALFSTTSPRLVTDKNATTTARQSVVYKKHSVWSKGDEIFVTWLGDKDSSPLYFCPEDVCVETMSVFRGAQAYEIDFLSGKESFIVFSTDNGIYVTEIDGRGGRNIQPLLVGERFDFRVDQNDVLFLKKEKKYYKLEFEF